MSCEHVAFILPPPFPFCRALFNAGAGVISSGRIGLLASSELFGDVRKLLLFVPFEVKKSDVNRLALK